jgi:predicted naringenin-chalcone synthase
VRAAGSKFVCARDVPSLTDFAAAEPRYRMEQERALEWLASAHARAEAALGQLDEPEREQLEARIARMLARVGCTAPQIAQRGQSVIDLDSFAWDGHALYDIPVHPHGRGTAARTQLFAELVTAYFAEAYAHERVPPDDLVHVTCTGYISPSGAQQLVAARRWPTRVTHAYHMGCYAAIPALRMAAGFTATGSYRCDVVHTELCSLHLDPADHSLEQLVVQSLFADGLIRYTVTPAASSPGLRVLGLHERVLPDTGGSMSWRVADHGMLMTLARDVPERVAGAVRAFVLELFARAEVPVARLRECVWAVHPGGPKIIDRVRDALELDDAQLATSRAVLRDHGNMSSATLPHVWMRLLADPDVPPGALVPSLAFGPGLTMCGALLEKR